MTITKKLLKEIAGLAARRRDDELLMLFRRRLRHIHNEDVDTGASLAHIIASAGGVGASKRFDSLSDVPKDTDSGMELLNRIETVGDVPPPILPPPTQRVIARFIKERQHADQLRKVGVFPPSSLALMGSPGTGKTSLAKWFAHELDLPFFSLNLASVVTSFLGQTGQNLKKALDRARLEPCVLLLDEFDALGYQRSNDTDVGEMKRVVTVLLQEIEDWPEQSVIIAATNLPEHVDPAFRRRFSRWIELPLPGIEERLLILKHYYGPGGSQRFIDLAAIALEGASGADLAAFVRRIKSLEVVENLPPREAIWTELAEELVVRGVQAETTKFFLLTARTVAPNFFSYRKLGNVFGISHTQVANILKKHAQKRSK